jgi:hypothetical protein
MMNYIASTVFGICIRWFVRLCEIFTSRRLQPQLAFEVMSHVHYKMAGHKWLLRLYDKTAAWWLHSELGFEVSANVRRILTAFTTGFVRLCRTFSAWWMQSQLVLTLCQMFAVRWLHLRLVCEVMSDGHCVITAITVGLYRIGWSSDNAAELYSGGIAIVSRPGHRYPHWGFSRLASVHPGKFRDSASIRPRPFGGREKYWRRGKINHRKKEKQLVCDVISDVRCVTTASTVGLWR